MDDRTLIEHITDLVSQEQRLQQDPHHDPAALRQLEVTLDQLWDLLRQRRAKEEFGLSPNEAGSRDSETVERYLQ